MRSHFAFPLLLAAGLCALVAAEAAPPQRSPPPIGAAVLRKDRRLASKVAVKELDRPLREILPPLGRRFGITLTAAQNVAADQLTVLCKQQTGAELLERLARHAEAEWHTTPTGYVLERTEAARKRDERLEREEFSAVRAWMDRLGKLAETPQEQLRARQAEVDRLLAQEGTPEASRPPLLEERDLLRDWFRHHRAVPVAVDLFHALTRTQLEQLRTAGYVRLSSTHGSLPPAFFARAHAALPNYSVAEGRQPAHVDATFELEERAVDSERYNSPRTLRLSVHLTAIIRSQGGGHSSSSLDWAARVPPVGVLPPGARVPAGDPLAERPLTLDLSPAAAAPELERYGAQVHLLRQWPSGWVRLGDVLSRVHDTTGMEIVADSFTRTRLDRSRLNGEIKTAELLDRIAGDLGYTWAKEGTVLRLWSRTRYQDRAGEVPGTTLRRFRERQLRQAEPALDDLAALTSGLSDRQCRNLADLWGWYFEGLGVTPPWNAGGVFGLRHHLRLWATLTTTQRRAAQAGVIPMDALLPAQRRALGIAISAPGDDLALEDFLRVPPPERLAGLSGGFTVRPEPRVAQCYIDDRGSVTTGFRSPGPDADLFNLRRFGVGSERPIGPAISLKEYRFTYYLTPGPDNGFVRAVQVDLLPRWQAK